MTQYIEHEIEYAWGISPEELEAKIKEGWAVISVSPYTIQRKDADLYGESRVMAVLRRKIPQGDDQGSES